MNTTKEVSIQPIDKATVNQICSGQVVLNLATAVKELLENSIDAGADSVQIKLEEYGSETIEVIDNGCGVEEINFQALTLKHHTSKIREFIDLYSVDTFGFRGEALSSLCSLSDVTITTQHKNSNIGATLKFDHNGMIISNVKTLRKTGTTVKLENLFCTLPIRRTEFIKNLKREYSKMCNVLYAYGLLSKGVRITCTNNLVKSKHTVKETEGESIKRSTSNMVMDTKGDSLESNIISIFGLKQKQNLIKIIEKLPSEETLAEYNLHNKHLSLQTFRLEGYISSCAHGCGRSSSDRQFFYINSRPIDNQKVSKLVNEIYHRYNNRQDPFVVLNIKVECGSFDMNLTPDKRQILLQNEKVLLALLKESLLAVFQNIPSTLEVQNLGLIQELPKKKKSEVEEKFEKFKAKFSYGFKSSSEETEKEERNSRVNSLLKYKLTSGTAKKASEPNCISKNATDAPIELVNSVPLQESHMAVNVITENNLQESCRPQIEFKTPVDVKEDLKLKANDEYKDKCGTTAAEVNTGLHSFSEHCESKRKLEVKFEKNIIEESETKRMKLDEGLSEEDKKKRKTVFCNVTFADIKNSVLKKLEKNSPNVTQSDVKFFTEIKPQNNERAENELKKELKKESFAQMEILGQFNLGFIITRLNFDLFIIDQHASDEKYNYETLQATTVMQTQKLINPERLQLTVDREELMLQHEDVFKRNGFDFVFNKKAPTTARISLTSIPMSKNYVFGKDDVDELLFLLEDAVQTQNLRPSRVNSMFASRACRKSVMIGTPLNHSEMRRIVDHMGEMQQPWNCPHGRPTMRHLVNLKMVQLEE